MFIYRTSKKVNGMFSTNIEDGSVYILVLLFQSRQHYLLSS